MILGKGMEITNIVYIQLLEKTIMPVMWDQVYPQKLLQICIIMPFNIM
jgi:hypothetical protein